MAHVVGKTTGMSAGELRELIGDYDGYIKQAERMVNSERVDRAESADEKAEHKRHLESLEKTREKYREELADVEAGKGDEAEGSDPASAGENPAGRQRDDDDGGDSPRNPAEQIGDAIAELEEATIKTAEAAVEAGQPEVADQVAARSVEEIRGAVANIERAADAVEEAAEEVAESAPAGSPDAEQAEEAVEAAADAQEAVDEAEAAVREEVREQGGEDFTREQAAESEIDEAVEHTVEQLPPAEAEVVEAIADSEPIGEPAPAPIRPEQDHPYYRRRKIFGKEI